ncbi:hypothetical protein [Streptomyces sp. NBC_01408]|uniref:hypothetical protein n=1 Tax=Streptomyces sp. NBC_01408 TaxID=2903855 RepID=UPI0022591B0D|nr:hypothetical protein [Streptomyces sp. NBC_01408]MCX4695759.1 hypothetical protein [Streptomyces sp. NBC_01408]
MSGPTVVIDRLSATLRHPADAQPPAADRLRGPLRHAVGGQLEAALRALRLPPGRWCLPRLDLTVPLDLASSDPALAQDWSRAVAAAIERTVREGGGAVVHYRHDLELLADAVAGLANGRTERLWAWRQTGVVRPEDPSPTASPGAALLAVLDRHPQQAAPAVLRAAGECGLAALDRALGRGGWHHLATTLATPLGAPPVADSRAAGPPEPWPDRAPGAAADPATRELARALLAGSRLAALVRETRLRPGEAALAAWALLVAAETDPASLHRPPRPGLARLLAEGLRGLTGAPAGLPLPVPAPLGPQPPAEDGIRPRQRPERQAEASDAGDTDRATPAPPPGTRAAAGAPPARRGPQPGRAAAAPGARATVPARATDAGEPGGAARRPHRPGPEGGAATSWAGLLFLLATAADAGLPARAQDEPALAARPLPWVLHAVGRALLPTAAADDPALLALAGLGPDRAALVLGAPAPTPAERARVAALAAHWARTTAARLPAPDRAAAAERADVDPVERAVPERADVDPVERAVPERADVDPVERAVPEGADADAADRAAPDCAERADADAAERIAPGRAVPDPVERAAPDRADADAAERAAPEPAAPDPVEPVAPGPVGPGPAAVVVGLARRCGRIAAEPGWIEVRLAVADTDVAVRRAGLDLDPGWVPWLGAVVRYVYV